MHGQMWDAHVATRLGYQVPNFTYPGVGSDGLFEAVAAQAVEAEESGFDTVLVMDHFTQLPMLGAPDNAMIECYTLLAALSQRTSRVRLSALVTGNTYRHPSLLAKTVTALDVVSGGRAQLGIGAGGSSWSTTRSASSSARSPIVSRSSRRRSGSSFRCCVGSDQPRGHVVLRARCDQLPGTVGRIPVAIGGVARRRRCGWWRSMPTSRTSSAPRRDPPQARGPRRALCAAQGGTARRSP